MKGRERMGRKEAREGKGREGTEGMGQRGTMGREGIQEDGRTVLMLDQYTWREVMRIDDDQKLRCSNANTKLLGSPAVRGILQAEALKRDG